MSSFDHLCIIHESDVFARNCVLQTLSKYISHLSHVFFNKLPKRSIFFQFFLVCFLRKNIFAMLNKLLFIRHTQKLNSRKAELH